MHVCVHVIMSTAPSINPAGLGAGNVTIQEQYYACVRARVWGCVSMRDRARSRHSTRQDPEKSKIDQKCIRDFFRPGMDPRPAQAISQAPGESLP